MRKGEKGGGGGKKKDNKQKLIISLSKYVICISGGQSNVAKSIPKCGNNRGNNYIVIFII